MTRYRFELAQKADDAELRSLLAQTPMEGRVSLSFCREPSYFAANCVLGREHQTIVCRDTMQHEIVGLATRSVRNLYVDGTPKCVGYLSSLRLAQAARQRGLLAHGFRFLRELHDADSTAPDYYLTTIADDNDQAIGQLTSGRVGLPTYHPLSRLHTLVLPVRRINRVQRDRNFEFAEATDMSSVVGFLNEMGSRRTFFPQYENSDFDSDNCTFVGLAKSQTLVAMRGGEIVGVAGVWDQRMIRQAVIHSYDHSTRWLRPLVNMWAGLFGGLRLPREGSTLAGCYVAFPMFANHDTEVFMSMLQRLTQMAPSDCEFLLLGLCDGDPLLPVARPLSRSEYVTRLYAVNWHNTSPDVADVRFRPYYLELGSL